jgi:hypothetical protein
MLVCAFDYNSDAGMGSTFAQAPEVVQAQWLGVASDNIIDSSSFAARTT